MDPYNEAHLFVATIRILHHKNQCPPTIEEVCRRKTACPKNSKNLCQRKQIWTKRFGQSRLI